MQQLALRARRRRGSPVVVTVSGELDLATSTRCGDYLTRLSDTGCHRLVLETAGLSFCDAAGLRVMVKAAVRAAGQHGWLRLAAPDAQLRRILELVELDAILPAYSTVAEALAGPLAAVGPEFPQTLWPGGILSRPSKTVCGSQPTQVFT